eukprot:3935863-Prymnesium_polylepis.1
MPPGTLSMHTRSAPDSHPNTPDFVRVLAQTRGGDAAAQPSRLRAAVFGSGPRGLPKGIDTVVNAMFGPADTAMVNIVNDPSGHDLLDDT